MNHACVIILMVFTFEVCLEYQNLFHVILHIVFECSITTQVKQEAVGLYEKLQDLEEKKSEIISENQKRGTPKEERERLLLQVNITYNNYCFDALIHIMLHDRYLLL